VLIHCAERRCIGRITLRVTVRLTLRATHSEKKVIDTLVLGSTGYSLASGRSETIDVRFATRVVDAFVAPHATHRSYRAVLTAAVVGGITRRMTVSVTFAR